MQKECPCLLYDSVDHLQQEDLLQKVQNILQALRHVGKALLRQAYGCVDKVLLDYGRTSCFRCLVPHLRCIPKDGARQKESRRNWRVPQKIKRDELVVHDDLRLITRLAWRIQYHKKCTVDRNAIDMLFINHLVDMVLLLPSGESLVSAKETEVRWVQRQHSLTHENGSES